MKIYWNNSLGKFPFNNRGEIGDIKQVNTETTSPEVSPQETAIPRTKEDWDKLAESDPKRWIQLTQSRMDQVVRESREWKEKAALADTKLKNLEVEVTTLKKIPVPVIQETSQTFDPNQPFSKNNLPQTEEQWDQLFIESPRLATDLRFEQVQQQHELRHRLQREQAEFSQKQIESRKVLWKEHPDMFEHEKDTDGKTKLDGNGKPILKINPSTNGPILDTTTEKGKLFEEVVERNRSMYFSVANGPELAMLNMERELRNKGMQQVASNQQQSSGQTSAPRIDQRGTLPGGITPPVTSKVSFSSDEEKVHAQKAVERGVYSNLEQYCQFRDNKNSGIMEENRVPKFG